jgi:peptide/nickel transport system substrate-binding protein
MRRGVEFRILGPLEVLVDGVPAHVGGPKQRALLALLLLNANRVVSRERLIDELFANGDRETADHALRVQVSRLRRAVASDGAPDRLVARPPGYLLRLEPGELDLLVFERLVDDARAAFENGGNARAAVLFREAEALWRGRPLADLEFEPFARIEVERLEEARLSALEDRIDAELAIGRHAALVSELELLVAEHPMRERLRAQQMLALYRAGRQADALAAYREARTQLVEELGLEPGPALRELEQAILGHGENLLVAQGAPVVAIASPPPPRPDTGGAACPPAGQARAPLRRYGRRGRFALLAGVLGAVGLAVGIPLGTGPSSPVRATVADSGIAALGAKGKIVAKGALPAQPDAIDAAAGSLWLADARDQVVLRVDPATAAVVDRIPIGGEPGSVTSGAGAIWAASTIGGAVARIDPVTGSVTQTIESHAGNAAAVAFGEGGLWVADATNDALVELAPRNGAEQRRVPLSFRPDALAIGRQAIWVASSEDGTVAKVDPRLGQPVASVHVGNGPTALALGAGSLWVANNLDSTVSQVDPASGAVIATIPVGSGPTTLAVADGSVWVANQYSGDVSRIDPRRHRVVATIRLQGIPSAIAVAAGKVWIGEGSRSAAHRGGTLTMLATNRFGTVDPGVQSEIPPLQFGRLAYDTLVALDAAPGPAGLRLVPDLAVAIPAPTLGGTTYTFELRQGIRYSDGRPLRASDFRRAVERLFELSSHGAGYFAGVVGAGRCRPAVPCDLSRGIRTDDATGTVVFQLSAPDPDFLFKSAVGFAAPIPPGTPAHDTGSTPVPGTGPYRIVAWNPGEIRFERNPFFHEWSHAAQPDGNPDVIVWRAVPSLEAAVRQVEEGRADWLFDILPPADLRRLRLERPVQLHWNPNLTVDGVELHPLPPFDDIRVRRALNYAIDRATVVRLYGGPVAATPTCQTLASGMPGYKRYCPYTLHPRADGRWTVPNLRLARRLVSASGTRGARVGVWGFSDVPYIPHAFPAYVASVLRSLGYRTTVHLVPFARWNNTITEHAQVIAGLDWLPDYPEPSSYVPAFLGCRGTYDVGHGCDPAVDRLMRKASELELSHPAAAAALWMRVDHKLVDEAWWAPTVNNHPPELVSRRLGNYEYHPLGDFIADQAWVR